MPHISQKKLNKDVFRKLVSQFSQTLQEADSISKTTSVLNELFTKTEKIMFAKRIATVYLLNKNVSFEKISEMLHIAPSTIVRYSSKLERGDYREILNVITKKGKLLENLEKLLQAGLPPIGKGRWKKI